MFIWEEITLQDQSRTTGDIDQRETCQQEDDFLSLTRSFVG
jgi:hypothetical protein